MRLLWNILAICILLGLQACKDKKPDLSGDEPVSVNDFLDYFPRLNPPFQAEDTSLMRKAKDTLLISGKIFRQFVPDSVAARYIGADTKADKKNRIYALGSITGEETYLFTKIVRADKQLILLMAFDKKKQFQAALPFLQPDQQSSTRQVSVFDKKYTISKSVTRRNPDGSYKEGKDVYAYDAAVQKFQLIMTDALDEKPAELVNPIDTLPRKHKYAANYGTGKNNLFSFRDGRRADQLRFFIHFEKNNGECTGELKGVAQMKTPNKAEYREPGEQCALQFIFSGSSVTVKELEACGSRRGLRCSFDGSYPRMKDPRSKTARK